MASAVVPQDIIYRFNLVTPRFKTSQQEYNYAASHSPVTTILPPREDLPPMSLTYGKTVVDRNKVIFAHLNCGKGEYLISKLRDNIIITSLSYSAAAQNTSEHLRLPDERGQASYEISYAANGLVRLGCLQSDMGKDYDRRRTSQTLNCEFKLSFTSRHNPVREASFVDRVNCNLRESRFPFVLPWCLLIFRNCRSHLGSKCQRRPIHLSQSQWRT